MSRPVIRDRGRGYASNEGNGMVGGAYGWCVGLNYCDFETCRLTECIEDDDDRIWSWFVDKIGDEFRVEAYIEFSYDYSVGDPGSCEIEEAFPPEQKVYDAIEECPLLTAEQKAKVLEHLEKMLDDLDVDDYDPYEYDGPDD